MSLGRGGLNSNPFLGSSGGMDHSMDRGMDRGMDRSMDRGMDRRSMDRGMDRDMERDDRGGDRGGYSDSGTERVTYCNIPLPLPKQLVSESTPLSQRLFIVCQPAAVPDRILRDAFSRFGNLIDVYLLGGNFCFFIC